MDDNPDLTINLVDIAPVVTCAIEVKDIDPSITKDRLSMIFNNERCSGGRSIEQLEYDTQGRSAVITFRKPEGQQFNID